MASDSNANQGQDVVIPPEGGARPPGLDIRVQLSELDASYWALWDKHGKLKDKAHGLEKEAKRKDDLIKDHAKLQNSTRKLYDVANSILGTITGDEVINNPNPGMVMTPQLIDKLCNGLKKNLSSWQGKHQQLHDKLAETAKVTEEFVDEVIGKAEAAPMEASNLEEEPGPSTRTPRGNPPTSVSISTGSLVTPGALALGQQYQPESSDFSCSICGSHYAQLGHVCSKMLAAINAKRASQLQPGVGVGIAQASPAVEQGQRPTTYVTLLEIKQEIESEPMTGNSGSSLNLPPEGNPADQGRHGNASAVQAAPPPAIDPQAKSKSTKTVGNGSVAKAGKRPSRPKTAGPAVKGHGHDSVRSMLMPSPDGRTQINQRRFFCKCGSHYRNWANLFHHVQTMQKNKKIKCWICHQDDFKLSNELKDHLKAKHGLDLK